VPARWLVPLRYAKTVPGSASLRRLARPAARPSVAVRAVFAVPLTAGPVTAARSPATAAARAA
ncbi:hypothetical protein, partial [Streptomyces sp. NPDC059900]|uniref:hypothetical protein n=1 Tax=Streptomyces sp. NPDC059900 TaxID=3155816 RepID=UPI003CFE30BB